MGYVVIKLVLFWK